MATTHRCAALLLALLIPVFAWAGLTYPGYFELDHGFRPIFNLTDLARSLPAIGWAPVVGQPYDLLRGEGALAYWLALAPRALGASPVAAVKGVLAASLLLGALGMYVWPRRTVGDWPGLIAAAVYALWPLGLATIYVRGALAEATLMAGLPWLLWLAASPDRRWRGPALALGLAAAIWLQAGLALWFAAALAVYGMAASPPLPLSARRGAHLPALASLWPVAAGLALGLLGLLPVALRHGLAGQTYVNFSDHFVYLHQLMQAGWGAGPSVAGPTDTLTFQLGLVACGLAVLGLLSSGAARSARPGRGPLACRPGQAGGPDRLTASRARETGHSTEAETGHNEDAGAHASRMTFDASRFTSRFALAVVLILALLSTTLAAPFWRLLPPLQATLTYPWQLLLLTGPWLAWLAGAGARTLFEALPGPQREAGTPLVAACLLTLTLLAAYGYLKPVLAVGSAPDTPLAVFGADEIALLDAIPTVIPPRGAATPALQASATISVTVRWQALRPLTRDYTVFLHLTDPNGQLQGQQDTMPQANKLPTTRWRPGQIVADQYHATLKPGAPAGEGYSVSLGLYLWQTGERLRTASDDKVLLKPYRANDE